MTNLCASKRLVGVWSQYSRTSFIRPLVGLVLSGIKRALHYYRGDLFREVVLVGGSTAYMFFCIMPPLLFTHSVFIPDINNHASNYFFLKPKHLKVIFKSYAVQSVCGACLIKKIY